MNRTSRFKTARGWHWLLASQCRAARFDDSKHRLASSEWHPCALVAIALALWSLGRHIPQAAGAEPSGEVSAEQELLTKSLPLRTALHHDPTLAAPLDRLVTLYRSAGRVDELLGMYRAHVAHYPADPGGRTVLIRLLVATGDPAASDSARAAAAQFPQNAFLQHVLYEILQQRRDPRALDHLDRAIALSTRANRKMAWIDELLPAAVVAGRRDLAEKHLLAQAALVDRPEECLMVARKMLEHKFYGPALELLQKPGATTADPETMVTIELEAAAAEVGLERTADAGARLDRLLAKLTADYWRRGEIVRQRLSLVATQAERDAMIAAARKRAEDNPRDVAAVLDLAQVLVGLQFRRDALTVLLEAGRRLPQSAEIERRTIDLFDRLRDERGREEYLAARIEAQPQRSDLIAMRAKTLFLLNRRDEALAETDRLLKSAATDEKIAGLLEMARFLRRSSLLADAAELFDRVVRIDPKRLDVMRELAETYLALGERYRVGELFSRPIDERASLENLLDLLQLMTRERFLVEARAALTARIAQQPQNLDLRVLLLKVEQRLGNVLDGEELIDESRELADTGARYRMWLEAAASFHDDFDTLSQFLEAEHARLDADPGEWSPRRLERRLAFAEVAGRSEYRGTVVTMLHTDLEDDLPPDDRVKIRRRLIALLEHDKTQAVTLTEQLQDLARDTRFADESHARLARLHATAGRHDLVAGLLDGIDVDRIGDAGLLNSLKRLYQQHGGSPQKILAVLERLTVLSPTERGQWKQWITALAAGGNEPRLRYALRRLLAGVEKMPLSGETQALLQTHVADSYWRSIARLLADGDAASLRRGLVLLDAVEQTGLDRDQALWAAWIRAYVLGRLDRPTTRDEAVGELERLLVETPPESEPAEGNGEDKPDTPPRIAFPDGLTISAEHARRLLTEVAHGGSVAGEARQGPLGTLAAKWTFETGDQAPITAILPLDEARTLICDRAGNGHCVDAATGKLLWSRRMMPVAAATGDLSQYGFGGMTPAQMIQQIRQAQQMLATQPMSPAQRAQAAREIQEALLLVLGQAGIPLRPLADDAGRLYVPGMAQVHCYAADDGRLLWRANVGAVNGPPAENGGILAFASIFLFEGNVLTFEPISGTLTKIDPATGKIVWDQVFAVEEGKSVNVGWQNAGASLSGNRLFVFGARTAVLDARSGEVLWSFEPARVRKFPLELREPTPPKIPGKPATASPVPAYAMAVGGMSMSGYGPYPVGMHGGYPPGMGPYGMPQPPMYYPPSQPPQYVNYLQGMPGLGAVPPGGISLVPPAVVWAAKGHEGEPRYARLAARRLLLFDSSGLQIIHTDLPLAGKRIQAGGRFVAVVDRTVCLLSGDKLVLVDVKTGTQRQCSLADIAGSDLVPLQAVADGALLYVTGPQGILCVKAATAETVFLTPWPADVAPEEPPDEFPDEPPLTVASSPYSGLPPHPGLTRHAYAPASRSFSLDSVHYPGVHVPPIGCVDRAVLYTLVSPWRVAALTEQVPDGE